jgi:hypothetical protein
LYIDKFFKIKKLAIAALFLGASPQQCISSTSRHETMPRFVSGYFAEIYK